MITTIPLPKKKKIHSTFRLTSLVVCQQHHPHFKPTREISPKLPISKSIFILLHKNLKKYLSIKSFPITHTCIYVQIYRNSVQKRFHYPKLTSPPTIRLVAPFSTLYRALLIVDIYECAMLILKLNKISLGSYNMMRL